MSPEGSSNEDTLQSTVASGTHLVPKPHPHTSTLPHSLTIPVIRHNHHNKSRNDDSRAATPSDGDAVLEDVLEAAGVGLKTSWSSVWCAAVMALISATQFTLYFTSLFSFMKVLDNSADEFLFGIVIAVYSLAQIIAAPIFGYWSNRIHQLRQPLIVCSLFMIVGNLIYAFVELFPSAQNYWLMVARFITGIGASNIGLLKAYASVASTVKDRRRAMAFVTGGNALGLTVGPGLQFFFTKMGHPGQWVIFFDLSMYTAPALLATLLNVGSVLVLLTCFQESFVGVLDTKVHQQRKKRERRKLGWGKSKRGKEQNGDVGGDRHKTNGSVPVVTVEEAAVTSDEAKICTPAGGGGGGGGGGIILPKYDHLAVGVCYALRVTQMFVFTNIETIGPSFEMMMFAFSTTQLVEYSSYAHMARGVVTLAVYCTFIFTQLGTKINDRLVALISLFGLFVYHVLTFSWPFLPGRVTLINNTVDPALAGGCNVDVNTWCDSLTQVNAWNYYILMTLMVGIAFANINVTMNTLFSRVIGPRMQGTQQGILQMCEGVSRMFGPLIVGFIYARYGPRLVWVLEAVVIAAMCVVWVAAYQRIVPLKIPARIYPVAQVCPPSPSLCTVPSKQIISPMELSGLSQMNQRIFYPPEEDVNGVNGELAHPIERSLSMPVVEANDEELGYRAKRIFTIPT